MGCMNSGKGHGESCLWQETDYVEISGAVNSGKGHGESCLRKETDNVERWECSEQRERSW